MEIQKQFEELTNEVIAKTKKALEDNSNEIKISLRKEIEEKMPELKKEDVDKLITENKDNFEAQLAAVQKSFTDRLDAMEIESKKAGKASYKSVAEQITEQLETKAENLKALAADNGQSRTAGFSFELNTKAVSDMSLSGNVSSSVTTRVPLEDRLDGFNIVPSRRVRLLDLMSPRNTNSNRITWVYQSGKEGTAGQTSEGSAKNQIDFDIVIGSEDVVKTTAYIKATTEMLDDIEWIQSEIQGELSRELLKAVESGAYNGNGSAPNLRGLSTVASAFAAGAAAGTVDEANEVDVINAAFKQIKLAEHDLDRPAIFMNPEDVYKLKSYKVSSSDRRYVDMVYMAGDQLAISGIPIVETTLISAGDYLVGDMAKALLVQKGGIRIEVGLDGNDFTNNYRTILAEWRGAVVVKTNDRTAFVAGDFATDKAALETT